jgi:hypothetical protein
VVKPATIRTVLSLACSRNWPVHQLDVKNTFLHGVLEEQVYCYQPAGFVDSLHRDHVCKLAKSLYGLKQAPRAWFKRFAAFAITIGFVASRSDASLFILKQGSDVAYLLLYVDDIVLSASTSPLLHAIIAKLKSEFAMKDMGPLHYFLGIQVRRTPRGFFLSQAQYADEILQRAGMTNCTAVSTPMDTNSKVAADAGSPVADPSEYRSLTGALQYLTMTRPDLAYAVQQICLHMHDPRDGHLAIVKRILRYVRGTASSGLLLATSLQHHRLILSPTRTPIGRAAQTHADQHLATVFISAGLLLVGHPSAKPLSRDPAPKRNIAPLQMLSPTAFGFVSYLVSSVVLSPRLLLFSATTSPLCTCQPIQFITDKPSTLS